METRTLTRTSASRTQAITSTSRPAGTLPALTACTSRWEATPTSIRHSSRSGSRASMWKDAKGSGLMPEPFRLSIEEEHSSSLRECDVSGWAAKRSKDWFAIDSTDAAFSVPPKVSGWSQCDSKPALDRRPLLTIRPIETALQHFGHHDCRIVIEAALFRKSSHLLIDSLAQFVGAQVCMRAHESLQSLAPEHLSRSILRFYEPVRVEDEEVARHQIYKFFVV